MFLNEENAIEDSQIEIATIQDGQSSLPSIQCLQECLDHQDDFFTYQREREQEYLAMTNDELEPDSETPCEQIRLAMVMPQAYLLIALFLVSKGMDQTRAIELVHETEEGALDQI